MHAAKSIILLGDFNAGPDNRCKSFAIELSITHMHTHQLLNYLISRFQGPLKKSWIKPLAS